MISRRIRAGKARMTSTTDMITVSTLPRLEASQATQEQTKCHAEKYGCQRHSERDPRTMHNPTEDISAEVVGAEPVVQRRPFVGLCVAASQERQPIWVLKPNDRSTFKSKGH